MTCTRCKLDKPLDRFSLRKAGELASGYRMPCKDCVNTGKRTPEGRRKGAAAARQYNAANRERVRRRQWARDLRLRFHMTPEEYDALLAEQGGVCAICRRPCTMGRLSVDHDRSCCPGDEGCGQCVRELLCRRCNLGLGAFGDDPASLDAAAAYLRRWVAHTTPAPLPRTVSRQC